MSTPHVATGRSTTLSFATEISAIEALADEWQALETISGLNRPVAFQSYGWISHVAKVRAAHTGQGFSPLVAVWRSEGRIVALLPLATTMSSRCRIATLLDDPFGQLGCILCEPDQDVAVLFAQLADELKRLRLADVLSIAKVTDRSPLYPVLCNATHRREVEHGTVVVTTEPGTTPEQYRATLSKKTRKGLRNAQNRLAEFGATELVTTTDRALIGDLVARSLESRYEWMVARGKTAPAFRDPAYIPMLRSITEAPAGLQLLASELRVREETLAMQWGLVHGGRYYAYISARHPEHEHMSPGRLHLEAVIGECLARDLHVLELMSPASPYKTSLGGQVIDITDFWLPLTAKGVLWTDVWRARIRPMLKSAYMSTPAGLRSRINGVMHQGQQP